MAATSDYRQVIYRGGGGGKNNRNDLMDDDDDDDDDASDGDNTSNNNNNNNNNNRNHPRLSAKPHAFAGAVLSPKHAEELTPALCLAIASALAQQLPHRNKVVVPYTLWITEAWRVLGWAEPSAALFWEMATMYHTLVLAGRAYAAEQLTGTTTLIPPILSCGSTSSVGSGSHTDRTIADKKKFSSAASAKELPVWLVGTFLLLHCEEFAYNRNLSGQDERRYFGAVNKNNIDTGLPAGKMDFESLFQNPSLSPRTRLHAGWNNDNTHCTAYLLRHLRKILLLAGISHNPEAIRACMHLAAIPTPADSNVNNTNTNPNRRASVKYSANELRRQHDDEHGNVGLNVRLRMEDLEHLDLLLQPPAGGGIEDAPLHMGELLYACIYGQSPSPPTASIPLVEVEREIRQHLELALLKEKEGSDHDDEEEAGTEIVKQGETRAQQPKDHYQKELSYTHLRGTTIVLKPNPPEASCGASAASGEPVSSRLHDLVISDCSDAHFYLLQPFEHATTAACTGCTIVVGAVAGLLHAVDCEKTTVTSAARRILVSNSCDVRMCIFSPSPPLLVGDNRTCQFAPYNTYYEGLREDLLATGLAAAVVAGDQSPFHGRTSESEVGWPPLQCASNKWKQPVELAKLEVPQVPGSPAAKNEPASPGADDKAMGKTGAGNDAAMAAPVLVPPSEFNILFVPIESEAARQRRHDAEDACEDSGNPMESQYCRLLAEVLQLSPFRLPLDYERRVMMKAERMRDIQQAVQKNLTVEQQRRFEEELNRGFRDWLVTSGNLRQVLDLVHLERRGGV